MYPKAYFIEKYQASAVDELALISCSDDYSDAARDAALDLLQAQGLSSGQIQSLQLQAKKSRHRLSHGSTDCDYCCKPAKRAPVLDDGQRFCSPACLQSARLLEKAEEFSSAEVSQRALQIKSGACPLCQQQHSAIEIRYHYRIWSAIFYSRWSERSQLSCLACARKANLKSMLFCFTLGWWGFPWGMLITPWQLLSNGWHMFKTYANTEPSQALLEVAKLDLAKRHLF